MGCDLPIDGIADWYCHFGRALFALVEPMPYVALLFSDVISKRRLTFCQVDGFFERFSGRHLLGHDAMITNVSVFRQQILM